MHHAPFTSASYLQLPVEEEKEAWVSMLRACSCCTHTLKLNKYTVLLNQISDFTESELVILVIYSESGD